MARLRRFLRWVFLLTLVLLTIVLAIYAFALRPAVERYALSMLTDMGLPDARLRIDTLDLDHAVVSAISLSKSDTLTIDTLEAMYSPDELKRGVVHTLRLTGATLRAAIKDGQLDLGPLTHITTGGAAGGEWPFARVELKSCMIVLTIDGAPQRFYLDGVIDRTTAADFKVDLHLRWRGYETRLAGDCSLKDGRFISDDLACTTAAALVQWPDSPVAAKQVDIALHFAADVGMDKAHVELLPTSRLAAASLQVGEDTWTVTLGNLSAHADVNFAADKSAIDASLAFGNLAVANEAADLSIADIHGQIPYTSSADGPAGSFATGDIHLGSDTLPPLAGSIRLGAGGLSLDADWPLLSAASVTIHAAVAPGEVNVTASLPQGHIVDPTAIGQRFAALRDLEIDGGVGVDAAMNLVDGALVPRVTLKLDGVTVRDRKVDVTIEGLNGAITLDHLTPPRTPPSQTLNFTTLRSGKLALTDGSLAFRIDSDRRYFVERVGVTLGSTGRLAAHAITYDLDQPLVKTDLYIESLNLGDWLSVLTNETIRASGTLYGRLPLTFRPEAHWKLTLGEGFLYNRPGPGQMALTDAKLAADLLAQADPRFATDPTYKTVRDRAVDALSDFEYSMFRFDLIKEDEGMMLRAETRGKGRKGKDPQEISSLVINIHHFDTLLNQALFTTSRLNIDDALKDFFEGKGK
ncbi:MAG: hypothetical protein GC162_11500 [Planctomycetes bacterium]|nr:hypothetical protein [Planctomycetota bacterium]